MGIEVLGPIRLSTGTGAQVEVPEHKVRLLLAALVAAGGEAVPADVLIERVWGDRLPAHPERVLRAKLSLLRASLDQVEPGLRKQLTHGPGGYTLRVEPGMIDGQQFTSRVARARTMSAAADREAMLGRALQLWRGEAYADAADQLWLAPTIASLQEARLNAVESRAEALLEIGDPAQALEVVDTEMTGQSLRERSAGARMLALYQLGRQREALEAYESLRRSLAEDLGADPTPSLRELHARILRHDPALATREGSPPGRSPGNLPAATTPLIGRSEETRTILALLEVSRLVTLTGVGGVGKTRLALHAARSVESGSGRTIWWIDLSRLETQEPPECPPTAEAVASHVIAELGLPDDRASDSGIERLADVFARTPVLLVLDNAEHVISQASSFTAELLRRTPGPVILVTSRRALGLSEEQRFEVGTLSTVSYGDASDAARFFIARARATDPEFSPHPAGMATIEQLCSRLDGLPLALELAAGRVKSLAVGELSERLNDRLTLLAGPDHLGPARKQTLRGTIEWSWSLLDARQQILLRRLAVHPGSWSLSVIETVCADPSGGPDQVLSRSEVVDALIGLVDQSMVATISSRDGLRYVLLESIRLYSAERLADSGEREEVGRRHREFFRGFAQQQDAGLRGPGQREALARLNAENVHIEHAVSEAVAADDGADAVALMVSMFWYRWITGQLGQLHERLTAAINASGPRDSTYATAVTLTTFLAMFKRSGDETEAATSALDLFDADDPARPRAQWWAGANLMAIGERSAGEGLIDTAIAALRDQGDDWHVLMAASQRDMFLVSKWAAAPRGLPDGRDLLHAARESGDRQLELAALQIPQRVAENALEVERAADLAEQALEISIDLGFAPESAAFRAATAVAAIHRGAPGEAEELVRRARAIAAEIGDRFGRAYADYAEAIIARRRGDADRARTLLNGWRQDAYIYRADPGSQIEHGYLSILEGAPDTAAQVIRDLRPLTDSGDRPRLTARLLELAAAIHHANGERAAAARTLGAADAHRNSLELRRTALEDDDVTRVWGLLHERRDQPLLDDHYRAGLHQVPCDTIESHDLG